MMIDMYNTEEEQPNKWKSPMSGTRKVNWDMTIDSSNKRIGINWYYCMRR